MPRHPLAAMLRKGIDDIARVAGGLWPRWNGWGWGRLRMLLPSARFDWEAEAGDPWRNSTVALGLAWLGDRFPRPRIELAKLSRRGEWVPLPGHAVVDLWERPNPYYNRRTIEKAVGLSLKCDGNAYVYKMRDRGGRVIQLWWLPHFRVSPTWPSDGSAYIDGYRIRVDGRNYYHVPPEDVIHIRDGIDPWDERLGLSALKSTLREVVTLNMASGYSAALMKNSGVPGVVFVPKGPVPPRPDKDAADRIKERFGEEFGGDLIGSPLVAAGAYDVVKLGFSPEELALDRLPRDAEARVAASIGVASMSLGLPDPNKTYSNLEEANRSSWGTVVSIQELIAEAVQQQLFPERIATPRGQSPGLDPYQYRFQYDYSAIQELQESLDAIHARARNDFRFDLVTRNEAREAIGYDPDPDGDLYFSDVQVKIAQAKAGGGGPSDAPTDAAPSDRTPADRAPADAAPTEGESHLSQSDGGKAWHDYSRFPSPTEYPATPGGFKNYIEDCKSHPFAGHVVDGIEDWLTKHNHCHGRDGRFCSHPSSGGAGGSFSPIGGGAGKPPGGGGGGGGGGTAVATRHAVDVGEKPDKEIAAHSKEMSASWRKGLSEDEHFAIRTYTGESYTPVNASLRDPKAARAAAKNPMVRDLDKALDRSSLSEATTVYRGVSDLSKLGIDPAKGVGTVVRDPAYMSTSLSGKLAGKYAGQGGAVLKITAPKGAKGASMSGISRWPKEHEVLFARGSGIRVTGIAKQKNGQYLVEAELVQ